MATTKTTIPLPGGEKRLKAQETFDATGETDWIKFTDELSVQLTGDATAVTAVVERSTDDPTGDANPAPVGEEITGDLTDGIAPLAYDEPGASWWRVKITALSGGDVEVTLLGTGW